MKGKEKKERETNTMDSLRRFPGKVNQDQKIRQVLFCF